MADANMQPELLYGFVFSFDQILDYQQSAQAMVSALYSIDCPNQARNHMKGMMLQGAEREHIEGFRAVVLAVGKRLGVRFKDEPIPVPEKPVPRTGRNVANGGVDAVGPTATRHGKTDVND